MTEESLVYRPEVLEEFGFFGTPDEFIEQLRNGIHLHAESVSYGIWHGLTLEERDAVVDGEGRHATPGREGEREARLVRTFQMLHRADVTVTHPPADDFVTKAFANFGYAVAISEGHAVGYMTLCDGNEDRATWDGIYETLINIWVAHAHRRSGVATALLEFVQERSDVAIARLEQPFSPAGAAWARAQLPDLLAEPGRNDSCPCGSGRKYKRCCGA